jgi:hypothetical protein
LKLPVKNCDCSHQTLPTILRTWDLEQSNDLL